MNHVVIVRVMPKILIYDRCEKTKENLIAALEGMCDLTCIATGKDFGREMKTRQYDLLFMDIDSCGSTAMKVLRRLRTKNPFLPIIVTSKSERADVIVEAMNSGASDFLIHPLSSMRINIAVDKAIEIRDQRFEIAYHRRKQDVVYDFRDVVACSPKMKQILKNLTRFAKTDSTILITGATGTGKSFLSGAVHFNSPRRKKPFIKINCANISEELLESELFGHEKGSFTGADKQRIGRFEQAGGGTIFLDEIGEISLNLQTKLLRVLEEKSFERIGGNKTIHADVRIIAATNKNLVRQVKNGYFREDLYYRINVLPVSLPPLRERKQCLLPLAKLLLRKYCLSMRREIKGFTAGAEKMIVDYDWPGNIRQLANTIERSVILEDSDIVREYNLSLPKTGRFAGNKTVRGKNRSEAVDSLADQEKNSILIVLEECSWVQKKAAKKLGISPRVLNYKIGKLGITHPRWRRNKGMGST